MRQELASRSSIVSPMYGGWICANCGTWVQSGVTHTCTWNYGYSSPPIRLTDDEIERIARRVADLLKEAS